MVECNSRYEMYNTLNLHSAYHQIPIKEEESHFTTFEARGNLYHFKHIPFEVTNGVICFQRIMDNMIREEKIKNTFAYLDNITICGENQEDHDKNLTHFLDCAKKYNITFNEKKSIIVKVKNAFEYLKVEITKVIVVTINPTQPLMVETDASDIAVAATLNQCGKPVAFFSRSLSPRISRMFHFEKSKNLPFSIEVKQMTANCNVCRELKPSFYQHSDSRLIKATRPFERLSVDFKGSLPSNSHKYLITAIDEYSCFPCPDMSASTIEKCFCKFFSFFGMHFSIHSDRRTRFMSNELKLFLHSKGIATSRTTTFNSRENGQDGRETTVSLSQLAPPKGKDPADLHAQEPALISQQPPDQPHLRKDMSTPHARLTNTCEQYEHSPLVKGAVDQTQDILALPDEAHDVKSSVDYNTNQNESPNSNTNANHSTNSPSHRHHTFFIRTRPCNLRNREA
ncbi:uncharacterized protein LOC106881242 [Octopus bimaculoides]|uniref:uncharacterized protein LOC106881242 n=1 Tax=Octopus bimaculoides TaxID=37653 RepID=UPI00071DB59A|nr:uncharacterized protein LOC106881242 [Octopus bimaculoides]|eukprot:XP_014787039.1 PREDICTED: uncharacterized protein LOC106881242 [Octopus bimaculoides]